jgi:hypothetical protein
MKKIFFTTVFLFGITLTSFANNIELKKEEITDSKFCTETLFEETINVEYQMSNRNPALLNLLTQITYCAQVQMDVKETYTAIFGPDRANSIALGAFMGCMGYL